MFEKILDKLQGRVAMADGGLMPAKRGLVDGPGGYAGEQHFNVKDLPPMSKLEQKFLDEYLKKQGVSNVSQLDKSLKSLFKRKILPKIKKFSKQKGDLIPRSEVARLLGVDPDYLRQIDKSQNVRYKFFQDLLGPTKLLYRPVTGYNEAYYEKPSAKTIEQFKKLQSANTILPVMQDRINGLLSNTKFVNMLKTRKLSDPKFLKDVRKLSPAFKNISTQQLADAVMYIARGSKGEEFLGINVKKNIPLHNKLMKQFEQAKWGNPFHAAAYKVALADLDSQLGNKTGTFKSFQSQLRSKLKEVGIKNLKNYEINELVGVSIGGKQSSAPYSVFTNFTSKYYNQGPGAALQGELSRSSVALEKALKEKNKIEANRIVTNYNKVADTYEKKYGYKSPKLDLRNPDKIFGAKRIKELGVIGNQLKENYKQKGFSYSLPKGILTQKEILKLDNKSFSEYFKKMTPDQINKFKFAKSKGVGTLPALVATGVISVGTALGLGMNEAEAATTASSLPDVPTTSTPGVASTVTPAAAVGASFVPKVRETFGKAISKIPKPIRTVGEFLGKRVLPPALAASVVYDLGEKAQYETPEDFALTNLQQPLDFIGAGGIIDVIKRKGQLERYATPEEKEVIKQYYTPQYDVLGTDETDYIPTETSQEVKDQIEGIYDKYLRKEFGPARQFEPYSDSNVFVDTGDQPFYIEPEAEKRYEEREKQGLASLGDIYGP